MNSSGKCQIIHWRQGHKEECHPPSHQDDTGIEFSQKVDGHEQKCDIVSEGPDFSNYRSTSDNKYGRDDILKAELSSDNGGTSPASETETTSSKFSGFSSSATHGDLSDDVSVSESTSSSDKERLDGHAFLNISPHLREIDSCRENNDQIKPLSPKFANLVISVNSFSNQSKSDFNESSFVDEENKYSAATNGSAGLSAADDKEVLKSHSFRDSSDFWDRALHSITTRELSGADETCAGNQPHSISSLSFSFSSYKTRVFPPCPEGSEEKHHVFSDTPQSDSQLNSKLVHAAPDVVKDESPNHYSSKCINFRSGRNFSAAIFREADSLICPSLSSGVKEGSTCAKEFNISEVTSSTSGRVEHGSKDVSSCIPVSRDVECASSTASELCGSSTSGGHTIQNITLMKADGARTAPSKSSATSDLPKSTKIGLKASVLKVVDQFRGSNLPKHDAVTVRTETSGKYNDKVIQDLFCISFVFVTVGKIFDLHLLSF